jgi:caffeoyl-CoA O-methyltransferase
MLNDIPRRVTDRMRLLEEWDARDRVDGTPFERRLRQIPASTGRLLALLAGTAPAGRLVEIGTSAGYSTLWLALAARAGGRVVTTFEPDGGKQRLARETFSVAGVEDVVELVADDARRHLPALDDVAFCFLDALKEIYVDCYELAVPALVPGGLLVADNVTSHAEDLGAFIARALGDSRVDATVIAVDRGLLLARRA